MWDLIVSVPDHCLSFYFEKYNHCKVSDKVIECEDCEKRFHASCTKLGDNDLKKH